MFHLALVLYLSTFPPRKCEDCIDVSRTCSDTNDAVPCCGTLTCYAVWACIRTALKILIVRLLRVLCHAVILYGRKNDTTMATYIQSDALSLFNMSFSLKQLVGFVAVMVAAELLGIGLLFTPTVWMSVWCVCVHSDFKQTPSRIRF